MDITNIADATTQITHLEPLSWWVGMRTPLRLMVHGLDISKWNVRFVGEGVGITQIHRADSPNYLFLDVEVDASAKAGVRYLVFQRGEEQFKVAYTFHKRRKASHLRESFTTADTLYLVMPDRFSDGDPSIDETPDTQEGASREGFFTRHGGDIQGIINHLDYIADLGATTLWPTPMLLDDEPTASYHGYAIADYYHIDPRMGDNDLYREMVSKAHLRGLKVVMDVVTNHCGGAHWWMKDLPFRDWVHQFEEFTPTLNVFSTNMDPHASKRDLMLHESGWFDKMMPDMNLDNEFVRRYFEVCVVWWIEWADLDGLRVDTYPYNEKVPMSKWCEAILREYPRLNIVGECWTENAPQLAYWQGGNPNKDGFDSHLPSVMDFPMWGAITKGLPSDSKRWGEGVFRIYDALSNDFLYADLSHLMIFVGNHDTDRLADVMRGNLQRCKIAMTLLATMRGIPQLFSGDEWMACSRDLSQGHGGLRIDFKGGWQDDSESWFEHEDANHEAQEMWQYTRKLFRWRKSKAVIHHGKTLHFASRDNTYAYFRYDEREAIFVFVNNSRARKDVPWLNYREITDGLIEGREVISGHRIAVGQQLRVEPRGVRVVEFLRREHL